jgi:D-proline reductase (dithiol) PrdB
VLARLFEAAGLSTILLTNMPYWAEKVGAPRTLAVEFPFGHIVGQPGNKAQQMRVLDQALAVLEEAEEPGTIVHFQEPWPIPLKEALEDCHPPEPPPVMDHMAKHIFSFMRGLRRSGK